MSIFRLYYKSMTTFIGPLFSKIKFSKKKNVCQKSFKSHLLGWSLRTRKTKFHRWCFLSAKILFDWRILDHKNLLHFSKVKKHSITSRNGHSPLPENGGFRLFCRVFQSSIRSMGDGLGKYKKNLEKNKNRFIKYYK